MLEILGPTFRNTDLNTFLDPFNRTYPRTNYGGRRDLFHRRPIVPIDVQDIGDSIVVRADIPGRHKNELNVELKKDSLFIETTVKESNQYDKQFILKERHHSSFIRVVQLPSQVDIDNVTSSYKDGVLEITLLKMEQDGSKKILIE